MLSTYLLCKTDFIKQWQSSGQVAQLFRASSQYTKVVGSTLGQGTHKNEPMNAK